MRKYTKKTLEDCLLEASKELQCETNEVMYEIEEEKKGLFTKKVTIAVYETSDVLDFATEYITDVCHALNLDVSLKVLYKEDIIKILIETDHNSVLIGRNGSSLQSLNELTKLAVSSKFKRKFKILLDVGSYKDKKYFKVISIAKKAAKQVSKTHIDVILNPMTPDERKKVHNALSVWKNIKTESIGDGKERRIVVKYVENNTSSTSNKESEAE